jgi:G3E family GTPase
MSFLGSELRDLTHLESIITLIDASNVSGNEDLFNNQASLDQITYGDIILFNKTDLVEKEYLDNLEAKIRDIKQGARIVHCVNGQVPLPLISSLGLKYIDDYLHYIEDGTISLVSFESDKPFAIRKFQNFLDNQMSDNVFRAIGMLWFDESPKCHPFNVSGKRFTIDDCEWIDKPNNKLVLVGQNLDAELIKAQLQECLV